MSRAAEDIGNRMVHVAHVARHVAAGNAADEIATADEVRQRGRGAIARFGRGIAGVDHRAELCDAACGQVCQHVG